MDPDSGQLTPTGHVPTGGRWPRHFSIHPSGRFVLVANQRSDSIVPFRLDPETGALSVAGPAITVPSPACVVPVPVG